MRPNFRRFFSFTIATFYFSSQVVLGSTTESNFWAERRRSISGAEEQNQSAQFASLPSSLNPNAASKNLLNQLPSISGNLPVASKWSNSKTNGAPGLSKKFRELVESIPLIYGTIQDVYDSRDDRAIPVVLIQDVHLNTEAQTNIASVLQELIDQKQVGLVGVEGAFDAFDFRSFRNYPNKEISKEVIEDLLNKNLLAAPSFVGITSPIEPPEFLGIDDKEHYDANLEALYSSRDQKSEVTGQLDKIRKVLQDAKAGIFSKELNNFDNLRVAYHKGNVGFGSYIKKLAGYGTDSDFVIQQFLEAYGMESSLDFKRVESERRTVIEKLTKTLDEKEISGLVAQSLAYRMGRMGFGTYYQGIRDLCEKKGIRLSQTPNFENYIRYVLLSDGIKADSLFNAVDKMEQDVVSGLVRSQDERTLADLSDLVSLIDKLLDFSLTPNEWEKYVQNRRTLSDISLALSKLLQSPPQRTINASLESFEAFYKEADIRSHKMVEKLVGHDTTGARAFVLGGFHSPQVAQILRKEKISYVIVSPKLTKIDDTSGSSYLSVFAREKAPLDRLFAGEKLFVYPNYVLPGVPSAGDINYVTQVSLAANGAKANATDSGYTATYDPDRKVEGPLRVLEAVVTKAPKSPRPFDLIHNRAAFIISSLVTGTAYGLGLDPHSIWFFIIAGYTFLLGLHLLTGYWVRGAGVGEESKLFKALVDLVRPGLINTAIADFGISSNGSRQFTREEHEKLHDVGEFERKISAIAKAINAPQRADGKWDIRRVLENVEGPIKVATEDGSFELWLDQDTPLPVLVIVGDFKADHAGRNEYAVYATSKVKAAHEIEELRAWKRFARYEIKIVSDEQIRNRTLGSRLIQWANGEGEFAGSEQELKKRRLLIAEKYFEYHQLGLEREMEVLAQEVASPALHFRTELESRAATVFQKSNWKQNRSQFVEEDVTNIEHWRLFPHISSPSRLRTFRDPELGLIVNMDSSVVLATLAEGEKMVLYSDEYDMCPFIGISAKRTTPDGYEKRVIGIVHIVDYTDEGGPSAYDGYLKTLDYLSDSKNNLTDVQIVIGLIDEYSEFGMPDSISKLLEDAEKRGIQVRQVYTRQSEDEEEKLVRADGIVTNDFAAWAYWKDTDDFSYHEFVATAWDPTSSQKNQESGTTRTDFSIASGESYGNSGKLGTAAGDSNDASRQLPADEIASKAIALLTTPQKNRQALADAIINLVDSERTFGDSFPKAATNRAAQWQDVSKSLRSQLSELAADGDFNSEGARSRLADLMFIMRLVLTDKEYRGFVGSLQAMFNDARFESAHGTALRVNTPAQLLPVLRATPEKDYLVVGIDGSEEEFVAELKAQGRDVSKMMATGHLKFIKNSGAMNALAFVQAARKLNEVTSQDGARLRLLILDGVTLPVEFFNVDQRELAREAFVFFIAQNLQAIEIDASLLPDWNIVRTRLIQA